MKVPTLAAVGVEEKILFKLDQIPAIFKWSSNHLLGVRSSKSFGLKIKHWQDHTY